MEILNNHAIEIIKGDLVGQFRIAGMDQHFLHLAIIKAKKAPFQLIKRGMRPEPNTVTGTLIDLNKIKEFTRSTRIIPLRRKQMNDWIDKNFVVDISSEQSVSNRILSSLDKHRELAEENAKIMALFLNTAKRNEYISRDHNFSKLITETHETHECSRDRVYDNLYKLIEFGFDKDSLIPFYDNSGGRGVPRPTDEGKQKSGRKPIELVTAKINGEELPPQYGITTEWKDKILRSWEKHKESQFTFDKLYTKIMAEEFNHSVKKIKTGEKFPKIPSPDQVRFCLHNYIPELERRRAQTTAHDFVMVNRGKLGNAHQGRSFPGHTYAIDSTIVDIYLLNSTRTHIIGRPVLYVLVDVFSSAIVGFYLTLHGQNWESVKVALFNTVMNPKKFSNMMGFDSYLHTFDYQPGIPLAILTDRGEYLSKGALHTCSLLLVDHHIVQAYRGDLKGIVEVMFHRIKDEYYFMPGTHMIHRKEFQLRKSRPLDATYTLHDFMKILYSKFHQYNMTANVSRKMSDEMRALGIGTHPAALWNWGFKSGNAFSDHMSESKLIKTFLPYAQASSTGSGIILNERTYGDQDNRLDMELATLSGFGARPVDTWIHPSNIQNIFTNESMKTGFRTVPQRMKDSSYVSEDEDAALAWMSKLNEKEENLRDLAYKVDGLEYREGVTNDAIEAKKLATGGNTLSKKDIKANRETEKNNLSPVTQSSPVPTKDAPEQPVNVATPTPTAKKNNFADFLKQTLGEINGK